MSDTNKPIGDIADLLLAVNEIRDAIRSATGKAPEGGEATGEAGAAFFRCEGCGGCSRCGGCFRCEGCGGCFRCGGCGRCEGCFRCFRCEGCR